jgi:hypothetical protein
VGLAEDAPLDPVVKAAKDDSGVHISDPKQGVGWNDCYLVASLAAVAHVHPELIESMIEIEGTGDDREWVVTFQHAKGGAKIVRLPMGAPTYGGEMPETPADFRFAKSIDTRRAADGTKVFEAWPMVLEAALAQIASTPLATLDKPHQPLHKLGYESLVNMDGAPRKMNGESVMETMLGSGKQVRLQASRSELRAFLYSVTAPVDAANPEVRKPSTPVVLVTCDNADLGFLVETPFWNGTQILRNHAYALAQVRLDAKDSTTEWISLQNPLGRNHLVEMRLSKLFSSDPDRKGVPMFSTFIVGKLASP